ncbi:MAG: hypothetical protein F4059_05665 [Gemmatimonadetes bacterium]|nr:hypothetical protein [Gemmatimonadota bacterium]
MSNPTFIFTAGVPWPRRSFRESVRRVALYALVPLIASVSWSEAAAQDPPGSDECKVCAKVQCDADPTGTNYKTCTPGLSGGNECEEETGSNGCPTPKSCVLSNGLCTPTMALADVERDRAVRTFEAGGMLPSDGRFYVGKQGQDLVLRLKCNFEPLARIAIRDVGRSAASAVLAE